MYINKIAIKNFRLLRDVSLSLEAGSTTIVGRNNSGKTSLTELFRRILSGPTPSFKFEDFSLATHDDFWNAFLLKLVGDEDQKIRDALPKIEVNIWFAYESDALDLGPLRDLIIDLNPDCTEALATIVYQLKPGVIASFLDGLSFESDGPLESQKILFCRTIKERIPTHYTSTLEAVDPNDPSNSKELDWRQLKSVISGGFINAQRGLDDVTHKDRDVLGKVLEALLGTAMSATATEADQLIAEGLKGAVQEMQTSIDVGFNEQLSQLLPAFALFGYPNLEPELRTETTLDIERLLTNHTRVHYAGVNGINLPEAYNGLGTRNLIYILLRLLEFYKAFIAQAITPSIHIIFIEEPEVHLHPQMQEVFVLKLTEIAVAFVKKFNEGKKWPVQFVVTTHSSHVANRAPFDSLRYFFATSSDQRPNVRSTEIKDLRTGLFGVDPDDRDFLHKYMTLTRCDLLFADKAILIEGPTERILLPKMIEKLEAGAGINEPMLSSQYVSVVEVGGAYAHLFFPLLRFLELRTLVITDLDTINANDKRKASLVEKGTHTSNECIKAWFGDPEISPVTLLAFDEASKLAENRRIAFEIPEVKDGPCGRSFEDAFILANQHVTTFKFANVKAKSKASHAGKIADAIKNKPDFALRFAIDETNWSVPLYIKEGLQWLAQGKHTPALPATVQLSVELPPLNEALEIANND